MYYKENRKMKKYNSIYFKYSSYRIINKIFDANDAKFYPYENDFNRKIFFSSWRQLSVEKEDMLYDKFEIVRNIEKCIKKGTK